MNLSVAVGKSDHSLGADDAPVTLVEYGDYQCPFCADMQSMIKAIAKSMGSQMRLVFRHMPMLEMHPYAQHAAEAAGARVIKPLDYLCDSEFCSIADKDGHLMYFNYGHLRRSYVRDHATYIDQIFLPDVDNAIPPDGPSAR